MPVIVLLAGPNGSGKSTLYEFIAKTHRDLPFVNADHYEREHLEHIQDPLERSRIAREWAEGERRRLLTEGISFIAETVFSHSSKIDLIREAKTQRFDVELHIIACDDVEILVRRVAWRAAHGKHSVPASKIRERYPRTMAHLAVAIPLANIVTMIDNPGEPDPFGGVSVSPKVYARVERGLLTYLDKPTPVWIGQLLQISGVQPS